MFYKRKVILIFGCLSLIILVSVFIFLTHNYSHSSHKKSFSSSEKIEDFEYMYNILEENYPFFEVKKRTNNIDWLAKKDEYKKRILNTNSDEEFQNALGDILGQLNDQHINLLKF